MVGKMNQLLLAKSVMRRLVCGSTCNRCISSQLSSPPLVVWREVHKPSSESVVMMSDQRLRFSGQWWRMMSSTSKPPTKNSKSTVVRKEDDKDKKTSGDSVEKMEREDEVAVSSYWGVSRPKITKEDGSVWPWNCFMQVENDSVVQKNSLQHGNEVDTGGEQASGRPVEEQTLKKPLDDNQTSEDAPQRCETGSPANL